MGQNLMIRFWW